MKARRLNTAQISKHLKRWRRVNGWTYRELSARSGIPISRLFDVEHGRTSDVGVNFLRGMAKAYCFSELSHFLEAMEGWWSSTSRED